jgi:hypothetical protein
VNVFRRGADEVLFVLTYGADAHWVKNVLASGEGWIRMRGKTYHLIQPSLIVDPSQRLVPNPVRAIARFDRVTEFLRMRIAA